VDLEEVDEEASRCRVCDRSCGKEFAAELDLLCGPPVCEREQDRVEQCGIDVCLFPAPVEVTGLVFGRDETAVEVGFLSPGFLESVDRAAEAVEQAASVRCRTESGVHLIPLSKVDARRE